MDVELMATIKVVMLDAPPDALQIQDLTILTPGPEQVLIKVAAFSHDRSERDPEWHYLPRRNTRVVGRPATVAVAAQPIQTVC
jgi:hypothetical protein